MRILLVFDSFAPYAGGSQVSTLTWFRNLKRMGHTVKILTDANALKNTTQLTPEDLIINRSFTPGKLLSGFSFSPYLFPKTKQEILDFKPDIIHNNEQLFVSLQVVTFCRSHSIPVLTTFHGDPSKFKAHAFPLSLVLHEKGLLNTIMTIFQFMVLKNADMLTAPSQTYQTYVEKQTHIPTVVVYPPVNASYFRLRKNSAEHPIKLITVSRLTGEKKVDVLIQMMQYLKDTHTLTIVGDGLDASYFKTLAKKLGVNDVITFTGWKKKEDIPSLITQHDLFLSASNFETFGMTYIEALATGTPVVAYDYAVAREVIPDGMAVFVPDLNPKTWAVTIEAINENAYKKLTTTIDKEYKKVEEYREDKSTEHLIQVYKQLIHN